MALLTKLSQNPLEVLTETEKLFLKVSKKQIEDTYKKLSKLSVEKLIEKRMEKYTSYGVYK